MVVDVKDLKHNNSGEDYEVVYGNAIPWDFI